MTTYKKNVRNTALIIAGLLIVTFSGLLVKNNNAFKKETNFYKIREDSILATKLLLDKEINDLNLSLHSYKSKNLSMDSTVHRVNTLLNEKVKIINSFNSERSSLIKLKKQLKELKEIHRDFEREMKALLAENSQLKEEVKRLNERLANQPVAIPFEMSVSSNNYRIELQRKNTKVTIKTKRIRNINVSFEVKDTSTEPKTENIYIVAKDANGNVIAPVVTSANIKGENINYSAIQLVQLSNTPQKINANIKPATKLKSKGIIKIFVYTETQGLIGSGEAKSN